MIVIESKLNKKNEIMHGNIPSNNIKRIVLVDLACTEKHLASSSLNKNTSQIDGNDRG